LLCVPLPPAPSLFPYTTLFRSDDSTRTTCCMMSVGTASSVHAIISTPGSIGHLAAGLRLRWDGTTFEPHRAISWSACGERPLRVKIDAGDVTPPGVRLDVDHDVDGQHQQALDHVELQSGTL